MILFHMWRHTAIHNYHAAFKQLPTHGGGTWVNGAPVDSNLTNRMDLSIWVPPIVKAAHPSPAGRSKRVEYYGENRYRFKRKIRPQDPSAMARIILC